MSTLVAKTALYDVERLRADIWRHAYGRIPADILTRALLKANALIDAKKTIFFAYEGKVRDTRIVDDNQTQLKAANTVLEFAGAKVRERDTAPSPPLTRLRYDPVSGLVEVIVGTQDQITALESLPLTPAFPELPPVTVAETEAAPEPVAIEESPSIEWLKAKRGKMPEEIRRMLFGEDSESDASESAGDGIA